MERNFYSTVRCIFLSFSQTSKKENVPDIFAIIHADSLLFSPSNTLSLYKCANKMSKAPRYTEHMSDMISKEGECPQKGNKQTDNK